MNGIGQVLELFDIYSPRPAARFVSLVTLAAGLLLLIAGADRGSATAILPLGLLVWVNRRRFLDTVEGLLERHPGWVIGLPLVVFGSKFLVAPPVARDDLLRHVVASFWPNGYADMYAHVADGVVIGNPYIGFDWLAGWLAHAIGPPGAMWILQAVAWLAFVVAFGRAGLRLAGGRERASILVLLALLASLHVMSARLFLARPEIFLGIWAIAAASVASRRGIAAWLLSGLALTTTYYLAPIYYAAALLLPLGARARLLLFGVLGAFWLVFWFAVEDGQLPALLLRPFEALAAQDARVQVSENLGILQLMIHPTMFVLALMCIAGLRWPGAEHRLLVLAGYFMLSNQVRFGGVIAPLLALFVLSGWQGAGACWIRHARTAAVAASALALSLASTSVPRYGSLPRFELPQGAVVLTAFDEAGYSLLFENPGKIRVTPIFDVGLVAPAAQAVVSALAGGNLDCAEVRRMGFTHVAERSLALQQVPDCLELAAAQQVWRLWRLR